MHEASLNEKDYDIFDKTLEEIMNPPDEVGKKLTTEVLKKRLCEFMRVGSIFTSAWFEGSDEEDEKEIVKKWQEDIKNGLKVNVNSAKEIYEVLVNPKYWKRTEKKSSEEDMHEMCYLDGDGEICCGMDGGYWYDPTILTHDVKKMTERVFMHKCENFGSALCLEVFIFTDEDDKRVLGIDIHND